MVPAVVVGLVLHDQIKTLFNPINVMYALVVGGVLLLAAEYLKPKQRNIIDAHRFRLFWLKVLSCQQQHTTYHQGVHHVDRIKPKQPKAVGVDDITYRQALMIGCFQCLALWPGFSRSGATISGGMLMGVSRYAASEFSFIRMKENSDAA